MPPGSMLISSHLLCTLAQSVIGYFGYARSIHPLRSNFALNVLVLTFTMTAAEANGYIDLSSIDPDNRAPGSFEDWLRLSMDKIS